MTYSDYRRYHRYQVFATAVLTTKSLGRSKLLSTQVNNISQAGLGVYSTRPIMHSTKVMVELSFMSDDGGEEKELIEGSVASLVKEQDHYFVGIAFNNIIPHESFMKMIKQEY
ncbi:MAG: PilZ domain-containing protein [Nitrospirota bacterium]|nr:MAG: PilZ domain-containing protein [Nitrospirota bacterium]